MKKKSEWALVKERLVSELGQFCFFTTEQATRLSLAFRGRFDQLVDDSKFEGARRSHDGILKRQVSKKMLVEKERGVHNGGPGKLDNFYTVPDWGKKRFRVFSKQYEHDFRVVKLGVGLIVSAEIIDKASYKTWSSFVHSHAPGDHKLIPITAMSYGTKWIEPDFILRLGSVLIVGEADNGTEHPPQIETKLQEMIRVVQNKGHEPYAKNKKKGFIALFVFPSEKKNGGRQRFSVGKKELARPRVGLLCRPGRF